MGRKLTGLRWPGGEHDFALRYAEIQVLQDKCDAGPHYIIQSIQAGAWRQEYLFETLRNGLIGGGMAQHDANQLIYKVRDDHPLSEFVQPALLVLAAAFTGYEDDPAGEAVGEAKADSPDQKSVSVASSEMAQP